ncbi:MAG: hypothetical protein RBU29_07710, partial [bacterium]|nr:hypothetical protein [bacterium]
MILSQGFLEALEPYSPSSSSSQPTILVVDDEAAISRSVAGHLTKMNLHVLLVTNATEALSLLQKHQVAVILSDQ